MPSDEIWSPERLAEAGVDVHLYRYEGVAYIWAGKDTPGSQAKAKVRRDSAEKVSDWVRRVYAEATRLAKEREKVEVRVYHHGCPASGIRYILTPDNRVVGDTEEEVLAALMTWCCAAIEDGAAEDGELLERLHGRLSTANAAIAAARKERA